MKGIYKKLSDKEINSFPKVKNKANISTLTTIIQHYVAGSSYIKTRKIKKADIKNLYLQISNHLRKKILWNL